MDMLRIGIMGVAGTLLAIQFKSGKSEYGIYITVVLSLIIFFSVLGHIGTIVETMKGIGRFIQMDQAYINQDAGHYIYCRIFIGNLQGCRISDHCVPD